MTPVSAPQWDRASEGKNECDSPPPAWREAPPQRPWLTLALWGTALLAAGAIIALVLPGSLTAQYSFLGNPDSKRGLDLLEQRLNLPQKANEVVIVRSQTASATDPAFRAGVLALQKDIAALGPGVVDSVASAYKGGDETLISADGRTTILPIVMAGDLTQADENIDTVHEVVHAADGKSGLDTLVTGTASINSDFSQTAEGDLRKGEGIGVPIALVILLIVFGAVVAAGLPIVLSLVAITAAVALTALVGQSLRRLHLRHQHGEHDGPRDGHRLLAVHHLAVPRGAGARAREDRRDRRDRRDREPRRPLQRTDGRAGASRPRHRADKYLRQPRDRRDPRGEHVRGRRAHAAAGRAQPARRPRQQPQGAVSRPPPARRPSRGTHLLDRAGGPARHEAAGPRSRPSASASCCCAPTPPST